MLLGLHLALYMATNFRCPHDEFSAQLLNSYFASTSAAHPEDFLALLSIPCFIQMVDLAPWVGAASADSPKDSRTILTSVGSINMGKVSKGWLPTLR